MSKESMAIPPDKTELRCLIPLELMQRLDAVARSKGYDARTDWLVPVLEAEVAKEIHAATVLLRMCHVNPLASE